MKKYDLIVIGAGSGLNVSSAAADRGFKVAIVEEGPMGGTCLNRGCIPSKMLIHSADVAETIRNAGNFGINPKGYKVNFRKLVTRVNKIVDSDSRGIEQGIREDKNTTLYKTRARFIGERTLQVGKETIYGDKVVIAAGTRPLIPNIEGLERIDFLTSTEALRLAKLPKSITFLGGGYISAELAHYFGSLGAKITIIQKRDVLIPNEDEEISAAFTKIFRKKYNVLTGFNAVKVSGKNKKIVATVRGRNGGRKNIASEKLIVAAGRIPNTDILGVSRAGIGIDGNGFIKTNGYMETSAKNVWALGDIVGRYLFKHSANLESQYVYRNAFYPKKKRRIDYTAMPHAIFSSPQIAGVGMTEQELKAKKIDYAVGKYSYMNTGMGAAIDEKEGFVKVLADRRTRKILGCHIIGADASTLIHEVIVAMKAGLTADAITDAVHIHPALSEVVDRAFGSIEY
ncbi:dihydrolipoyl dehydrogenase [Candidatus Woesearchaeota archaeon]|nr:dihydrolipoyl dehydrogenase [Candidatus Woesearchaeota archaeon]MBI2661737.1 dihydrolipoyl dehydrogenase [Candidatus Woesearchaeota archaeon]